MIDQPQPTSVIDMTKRSETQFRGALENLQKLTQSIKRRDEIIITFKESLTKAAEENTAVRAENMSLVHERDALRGELAALRGQFDDFYKRTVSLIRFVETRCTEIVDQEQRAEGVFLHQEANRSLGEPALNPSDRFMQFRRSFQQPVASHAAEPPTNFRSPIFSEPAREYLFSDSDLGLRSN